MFKYTNQLNITVLWMSIQFWCNYKKIRFLSEERQQAHKALAGQVAKMSSVGFIDTQKDSDNLRPLSSS